MRSNRTAPKHPATAPGRDRGFTVIELMIVLVVTALLLALATPNLRGLLARNQLLGQVNELAAALTLARSEAVSRGVQAGVCASDDGATCSGDAGDWSEGILVYVDQDNDSTFDNTEQLLKYLESTRDVNWTAAVAAFHFNAAGFSTLNAQTDVTVCHETLAENDQCRRVTVQPSGIVSVTSYDSSS